MINIGSFVEKKINFAVHILKDLIDKGYCASLTFLGEGSMKNEVESLALKYNVHQNINL